MLYICKNKNVIYFLVKCSISKVSTVHNISSKLGHSLRRWPVIDALLYKYLVQKETQQFQNALISCNLLKTFQLIKIMLVCIRILCFDLNNGQVTFKSKKVKFEGHGPADNNLNMRVI